LLAKAECQLMKMSLKHRFREQARSHRGLSTSLEGFMPWQALRQFVEQFLLAFVF
jgi:hypothetical protein